MALRTAWQPSERWRSGIAFSAKQLLEVAVMLLGASVSFAAIAASGYLLVAAIAATVGSRSSGCTNSRIGRLINSSALKPRTRVNDGFTRVKKPAKLAVQWRSSESSW